MSRAYKKTYLNAAMRNLGVMLDCGVNKYNVPLEKFYRYFLQSDVSKQFGKGNPRYLVGCSGVELADMVAEHAGMKISDKNDGTYQTGAVFWTGWALAYYQWKKNRSFAHIEKRGLDVQTVCNMFFPLHEADLDKFVEVADSLIKI